MSKMSRTNAPNRSRKYLREMVDRGITMHTLFDVQYLPLEVIDSRDGCL